MSYRGTSLSDDVQSLRTEDELSKMKFPKRFSEKVELRRINANVIVKWIEDKLEELIPEDDIIVGFVTELVFGVDGGDVTILNNDLSAKKIDPRYIQLQLIPFLDDKAATFTKELWNLLLAAQESEDGVPPSLAGKQRKEKELTIPQRRVIGRDRSHTPLSDDDRHRSHENSQRYPRGPFSSSSISSYDRHKHRDRHRSGTHNNRGRSYRDENRAPKRDSYSNSHHKKRDINRGDLPRVYEKRKHDLPASTDTE